MRAIKNQLFTMRAPSQTQRTARWQHLVLAIVICAAMVTGCKTGPAPGETKQFVSQKTGKTFAYVVVPDTDEEHEPFELPAFGARSADNFTATDRKAAKTSISSGPLANRADVADVL